MTALRDYQRDLIDQTERQWALGALVVLFRLATGGGKTVCFGDIIKRHAGASCLLVHRTELVWQISITLARLGIRHDLIASTATKRMIARMHVEILGQCFYQPGARCVVASVDTLVRAKGIESWAAQVTLWICDEGHHALRDNKWGKAISLFTHPACRGLLPTATPVRADGAGLGSHADGFADVMVDGPPERWLIDEGYLSDYIVYCPPSDLQVIGQPGASGDYSPEQLKAAAERSHIVGDVAASYARFGERGQGLSFCTDVERAVQTCAAHRDYGARAEVVTGDTDPTIRRRVFERFEHGEIDQICVVDIVSEGTDLPACIVGSFGRPSESLGLVRQQMGRLLRPMYRAGFRQDGSTRPERLEAIRNGPKPRAILIDHVQHFAKPHIGPPDKARVWSLDRRDRKSNAPKDVVTVKVCTRPEDEDWPVGCYKPYEAYLRACPFCEYERPVLSRSSPAAVEGDLALLDPAVLAALRGEVARVDMHPHDFARGQADKFAQPGWIAKHTKAHVERQAAQGMLRAAMGRWGDVQLRAGLTDEQMQRRFWLTYGIDVLGAKTLGAADAWALLEKISY